MDTSIANDQVAYVLHGHVVDDYTLTPKQWLEITNEILKVHRAHAKYWPFIKDHDHAVWDMARITGWTTNDAGRPQESIFSPKTPSLSASTRLFPVTPLWKWEIGWSPEDSDWKENVLAVPLLFLTDTFNWVIMTRRYVRDEKGQIITRSDTFRIVSEKVLLRLVGNNPRRWYLIISSLQRLAEEGVQKKEKHIETLYDAIKRANRIIRRIRVSL
jgi:hypothetical protein